MRFRFFLPIVYAAMLLASLEIGLEYRGYWRGYDTILFGPADRDSPPENASSRSARPDFGPTATFPFRSRIITAAKPKGTTRFWIASASYAEDVFTPVTDIFPVIAERELRAKRLPVEVLNASRAGYRIRTNTADLESHGTSWGPDFVLLYQMSTDINTLSKKYCAPGAGTVVAVTEPAPPSSFEGALNPVRLFERTTTYEQLKSNITTRISASRILSDDLGTNAIEEFAASVRDFVITARSKRLTPLLCTFCMSYDKDTMTEIPEDYKLSLLQFNPYLSPSGWARAHSELNDCLREIAAKENVPLIDLEPELSGRPELFRDLVHLSRQGHRTFAKTLSEHLVRCLRDHPPARQMAGGQ